MEDNKINENSSKFNTIKQDKSQIQNESIINVDIDEIFTVKNI